MHGQKKLNSRLLDKIPEWLVCCWNMLPYIANCVFSAYTVHCTCSMQVAVVILEEALTVIILLLQEKLGKPSYTCAKEGTHC